MRIPHAILLAVIVGLVIWSPSLSARDDPASIYADEGLGRWVDDNRISDSPIRIQHGPVQDMDATDSLLVVGPRLSYSPAEAKAFNDFLASGGRALVADSTGTARQLLGQVSADITETQIYSTSYSKNVAWPIAEGIDMLPDTILSRPHAVTGNGEVLLASHPFSWLDLDNDLAPDLNEPIGAWPVAMRFNIGAGELIVVGDDGLFFEDVSRPTAELLLEWLAADRTVVVDEGHRASVDPLGATPLMAGARPILAIGLAVVTIAGAWAWDLDVRVRRIKPRPIRITQHDPVLDELPDAS